MLSPLAQAAGLWVSAVVPVGAAVGQAGQGAAPGAVGGIVRGSMQALFSDCSNLRRRSRARTISLTAALSKKGPARLAASKCSPTRLRFTLSLSVCACLD